nr:hypothetical protein [Tanacetum cinerariifolium]
MDKSWMRTSRTKKQYIDGVEAFIKIDLSYTKLDKHREKDEQATTAQIPINATTEFGDDTDIDMDFGSEIQTDGLATVEMVNATKESLEEDDLAKFQELLLDAEKPLYKGCPDFTKLSAIVKLVNLKGKYGASDKFFTELLGLLKKMLPASNEMVEKTYQAKKLMRMMGSGYKKIHVCSKNCILYRKDNKDLTVCPTYGISRWKVDNKTHKVYKNIPAKVMWYFTIIPRLQRLFKLESISEDLRWHATRRIKNGVLRHLTDSQAWCTIDEKFPKIAKDPRNLRLGISADGVYVNSGTRHHSVWPVLSIIYNLPPWLCMKRKFIMLSVLIFGYPGKDIDVHKGHVRNRNRPEGRIAEETITEETIEFFSEYHKTMKTIGIPPDKHVTNENEDGKPLSIGKSSEVYGEVFQKAHLYVERELTISKDSVLETVRWISYRPRATIVKYEVYNINGYTFRMKSNDGIVYQNSGVSVEALYGLVDLNSFGHKDDPFILASQAQQVFYVKDQIDKKLSIVVRTPTKNYKDTYDKVDEEFSIVIYEHNDNILPRVNRRALGNESQNEYYQTDCEEPI